MPAASKRQSPLSVIISPTKNTLDSEPSSADSGFIELLNDDNSIKKCRFDVDYKRGMLENQKLVPSLMLEASPASSQDSGRA